MKIICDDGAEVIIEIPEGMKNIGVMVSGGMDSALLLYLLMLEKTRDVKLQVFNVPNIKDNASKFSRAVVNYIENKFCEEIKYTNVGDGTLRHNFLTRIPATRILQNKIVERLYVGINQNPPVQFPKLGPWRQDPNSVIPNNLSFPFIKLYKNHILEIYKKFNVLDLVHITHSCTESLDTRCNECFQCYERAWAFSKLNLIDNGI